MSIEKIMVPDLGDATEVEVIELLVSVGQTVAENDSLLVLESDKAAMEIPAPMAGVVKSIAVNLGDQVTTGSEMLSLEVEQASAKAEPAVATEKAIETETETEPETGTAEQVTETATAEEATAVTAEPAEPPPQASATAAAASTIEVPDLGTEDEVDVIEIHVKAGDVVAVDDALLTLETDKAAMEVPSPQAGTIESLLVAVGDKVKTGTPIVSLLASGPAPVSKAPASKAPASKSPTTAAAVPAADIQPQAAEAASVPVAATPSARSAAVSDARVYAGPAVRKLARELGVDLQTVTGSGAKSRITKEDLHNHVKNRINAPSGPASSVIPDIDFSQFGETEQVARSKIQRLTAINMHRNWTAVPHVAQFNEADITDLEEFRSELKAEAERKGVKLTFMPFLLKACALSLTEYPQFNVSLHSSGEYLIQKKYIHIGVAVATEAGLVVPVIRDVDKKTIWQLASEVIELTNKAKQRKLTIEQMQGACFTISSLGAIGGTGFIPIVNAPEVAILGVSKTAVKPVYIDGEFQPRKMLPLTLAYDHKAVNGVDGGLFATYLAKVLGDIRYLSL